MRAKDGYFVMTDAKALYHQQAAQAMKATLEDLVEAGLFVDVLSYCELYGEIARQNALAWARERERQAKIDVGGRVADLEAERDAAAEAEAAMRVQWEEAMKKESLDDD